MNSFCRTFFNLKSVFFSFLIFLFFSSTSWATVLYVSTSGNDANDCSNSSKCLTIQRAIDVSSSGDTISIGAGTFTGANTLTNTSLSFEGAGAGTTIIDGGGVAVVFTGTFVGGNNTLSFTGMTIQNGSSGVTGGAIVVDCDFGTPTTVNVTGTNLLIQQNNAGLVGSGFRGLQCANSDFNFSKTTFANNTNNTVAVYGTSNLNLTNVTFYNNTADIVPGALLVESLSTANLNYVTFDSNTGTTDSGGVYLTGGTLNSANTIYNNNAPANCAINLGTINSSGYNISSDASCSSYFVDASDLNGTDPVLGTYGDNGGTVPTIPLLEGSPAINAGGGANCPATDARDVSRPQGDGCDIGAYEVQAGSLQPTPSSLDFTDSTPQNVSIALDGIVPVAISNVMITGSDSGSFSFNSTDCIALLPVSGTCSVIGVQFLGVNPGSYSANLEIENDGGTNPTTIALTGNIGGGGGVVEASPANLEFSSAGTQSVNFSVSGNQVNMGSASISGDNASHFSISTDDCSNTTLTSSSTCKITVVFDATDIGTYSATLNMPSDGTGVNQVSLFGSIGNPSLSLSIEGPSASVASSLSIGSIVTYKVTVQNKGSGPAPDTTLTLALPPSLSYSSITLVQNLAALGSDMDSGEDSSELCLHSGSTITCEIGSLEGDSTFVLDLATELIGAGSLEVIGTLTSGSDSVTATGSSGVSYNESGVTGGCSLSLEKNIAHTPVLYGFILVLLLATFYMRRNVVRIQRQKEILLRRKKTKFK